MSVYIPNMEMPTRPVLFCIHPDGKVFADLEGGWREYKVVPVPPHGRLIDADALGTPGTIEEDTLWRGRIETEVFLASTIYNAATIIPADKEVDYGE